MPADGEITREEWLVVFGYDKKREALRNDVYEAMSIIDGALDKLEAAGVPGEVTGDLTPDGTIGFYKIDSSSGAIRITLNATDLENKTIYFKKVDNSGNLITFEGALGTETIDGESMPISDLLEVQNEGFPLYCDGTDFFIK